MCIDIELYRKLKICKHQTPKFKSSLGISLFLVLNWLFACVDGWQAKCEWGLSSSEEGAISSVVFAGIFL